jgi:hypothetical protein
MGTTDLLAGGSWSVVTAAGFAATHSGSPSDPEGIEININQIPPLLQGDPVYSGVMLKWNSAALDLQRGAEYTLVFEARASDSITYNGKTYDGLPGLVRVRDFDGTIARFNFLVPGEWRTYYMSYVVPESGGNARFNGSFQLGEEAQRTFRLRNIRLYTGTADRLKREFENGVVLLNESEVTPWTAALGSGQHRRLKGSIRPDINTGATVTGSVNVPARDAVYLLKPTYANWAKERGLDMDSGTGAGMSDDPEGDGRSSADPEHRAARGLPHGKRGAGLPIRAHPAIEGGRGLPCRIHHGPSEHRTLGAHSGRWTLTSGRHHHPRGSRRRHRTHPRGPRSRRLGRPSLRAPGRGGRALAAVVRRATVAMIKRLRPWCPSGV